MRESKISRETKETSIKLSLNLDGKGNFSGNYPIPYFKHLLSTLTFYAKWDLDIDAKGDIEVDIHHLIEDTGIVLGEAFYKAVKTANFKRFSHNIIPMDEALVMAVVDISGRPFFELRDEEGILKGRPIKEFLRAFINNAGITLHIWILSGENTHHIEEAIFKALGLALREAGSVGDILNSTKGNIL